MTPLRQALADYLRIRRALGYKLERAGKLLPQFVDYLEQIGRVSDFLCIRAVGLRSGS